MRFKGKGAAKAVGQNSGLGAGPGGVCACPKCSYSEEHQQGIACYTRKCPQCGTQLVRK